MRGDHALRSVNHGAAMLVGVATVVVGLVVMVLPWPRWPQSALMVLPVVVLVIAVPLDRLVRFSTDPAANASFAMLAFTLMSWIGLTQPRWTAARFAPFLAAVLAIDAATLPGSAVEASLPLVIVPVAAVLAEVCSGVVADLTEAREAELSHSRALALVASPFPVEADRAVLEAAVIARAYQVFGPVEARLVLTGPGPARRADAAGLEGLNVRERVLVTAALNGDQVTADEAEGVLVAPLAALPGPIGALVLRHPRSTTGRLTFSLARLLGRQAGSALAGQHLIDTLFSDTRRDALTGVGNRRAALDRLDALVRGDTVAVVDVDDFKRVNDSQGHAAGDDLLCRLAAHLEDEVGGERVARLGGDEFLVVLSAGGEDAEEQMRRVVHAWREREGTTTLSVGLARKVGGERRELMERADAALYLAKSTGRNRVVGDRPPRIVS